MRATLSGALAGALVLAGCSSYEEEPVEAVSPSEAKALDEAAAMLDERRPPEDVAAEAKEPPLPTERTEP